MEGTGGCWSIEAEGVAGRVEEPGGGGRGTGWSMEVDGGVGVAGAPPCEGREATRSACACACVLVLGLCCRWAIFGTWIYTFETLCIF